MKNIWWSVFCVYNSLHWVSFLILDVLILSSFISVLADSETIAQVIPQYSAQAEEQHMDIVSLSINAVIQEPTQRLVGG